MIKRKDFIWHPDDAQELIGTEVWMFCHLDGEDAEKHVLEEIGAHSTLPFRSGDEFFRFIATIKEPQGDDGDEATKRNVNITIPVLDSIQEDLFGAKVLAITHEQKGLGVEVKLPQRIEDYFKPMLMNLTDQTWSSSSSCTIHFDCETGLTVTIEGGQLDGDLITQIKV